MRDGVQVQAGIGLSLIKRPMQVVAIFPSQIYKVDFTIQALTTEMQGVCVSSSIAWTVYREEDGPMRAYKYLGNLNSRYPEANNLIISLASAVVRNEISNTTITEVMKSRDTLRKQIRSQLKDMFKGWGVWMETIEITDVKIASSSTFKNLQTEFREREK